MSNQSPVAIFIATSALLAATTLNPNISHAGKDDMGGLKEWTTDQSVDEESTLDEAAEKLKKIEGENDDEQTGINIITRAVEEPLRQIVENAGLEGSVIVSKVLEGKADFGFNAKTETYEGLYKAGVIDPAKVVRVALENAASVAGMLLTTECVISDVTEEAPAPNMPPMGGGGMPGMM